MALGLVPSAGATGVALGREKGGPRVSLTGTFGTSSVVRLRFEGDGRATNGQARRSGDPGRVSFRQGESPQV